MLDGFVKVSAATPKIRVLDVEGNLSECIKLAHESAERGAKIIVFPELVLTGATAGDLLYTKKLLSSAEAALARFADETEELDVISFIGLPVSLSGKIYNAVAAVSAGDVLAVIPKTVLSSDETRYFAVPENTYEIVFAGRETLFGTDILLSADTVEDLTIAVAVGAEIYSPLSSARYAAVAGASVIVNPISCPEIIGKHEFDSEFLRTESRVLHAAVIRASAGIGESGTDGVYAGISEIAALGKTLVKSIPYSEGYILADIDVEYIAHERIKDSSFGADSSDYDIVEFSVEPTKTKLEAVPRKLVFVPEEKEKLLARCGEILEIQSRALAERIRRSYSKGAVIGVSGGLDSTLALLVAVKAMDILGESRKKVTAITMPCFGTTKRTKSNAERLAEALGTTLKCIDIKASVNQHFEDIGHDAEDFSVVYENAQARERTQVLMDVANAEGALVVGTGDLSELALGFATYNGDHMSMYGVNAGIPKTLMRYIVSYCAETSEDEVVSNVLYDVLATPVSPELLPPKDGEIAQCTEGIVGPYELHDFFIYYLVRRGYSPEKILRLATLAFEGEYDEETIKGWLKIFLRRFFSQQFKRSCLPDGPKVGTVGFSPRGDFKMPSDGVGALWNI